MESEIRIPSTVTTVRHSTTQYVTSRHDVVLVVSWRVVTWRNKWDLGLWLQANARDRGLGLWPRLYAGSVCDDIIVEAAHTAILALYKWTSYLLIPFLLCCKLAYSKFITVNTAERWPIVMEDSGINMQTFLSLVIFHSASLQTLNCWNRELMYNCRP